MTENVYISYNSSGKVYADSIYSQLKNRPIRNKSNKDIHPFYPANDHRLRNVCAKKIIPSIRIFIMILTEDYFEDNSSDADFIKEEINLALKSQKIEFISVFVNFRDHNSFWKGRTFFGEMFSSRLMEGFVCHYENNGYFDVEACGLIEEMEKALSDTEEENRIGLGTRLVEEDERESLERIQNPDQMRLPGEEERLEQQQKLLLKFDCDSYKKIFANKPKTILDIGCNNGDALFDRLDACQYRNEYDIIIGVDICKGVIKKARRTYGSEKNIFEVLDVEDNDFLKKLKDIMNKNNITSFDFVNISSVLLQLKDPGKFLSRINSVMGGNSHWLIIDVDDSQFMAYPDEHNYFAKLMEICNRCERTGYRQTGRQIYTLLKNKTDCQRILFEKSGLNTASMNRVDKDSVFDVIFNYIERCIQQECGIKKRDKYHQIHNDAKWFISHRDEMRQEYDRNDFFLSYGYVIYLAEKSSS